MKERLRYEIKGEHPLDRMVRIYSGRSAYTLADRCSFEVIPVQWRFCGDDGYKFKVKNKRWEYQKLPSTTLVRCWMCGILTTPKKVQSRPIAWHVIFVDEKTWIDRKLCMGCWNKMRPIEKTLLAAEEIGKLIRSTQRKINEATKNNARTS